MIDSLSQLKKVRVVILESQLEFHDHASETDPVKLEAYYRDAEAGLKQIQQYLKPSHRGVMEYTLGE